MGVTKAQFCSALSGKKPYTSCDFQNPPPSPGITVTGQTPWQPNGCGTGPMKNWLLARGMGGLFPDHFSGNLDAPYSKDGQTVSFLSACNAHDKCWGEGSSRTWCDQSFHSALINQCEAVTDTAGWGTCTGMASQYHAAVASDQATGHYQNTDNARQCAVWSRDMRRNCS